MQAGSLLVKPASQHTQHTHRFESFLGFRDQVVILHIRLCVIYKNNHFNAIPTHFHTHHELQDQLWALREWNLCLTYKSINLTYMFFFSLEEASTADGHPRQMSFSHHWQHSTRMLQPCSHNIIPATAPSPVTVTRDIGLRPTQHRPSMIPCPCVELVSLILSLLLFFPSVAFSSNIALDGRPCRFVSKLRRLLSRDDLKSRRGSRATARTAWTASLSFFFFFCSLGDLLEQYANDQRFTSRHPIVLLYEATIFWTFWYSAPRPR